MNINAIDLSAFRAVWERREAAAAPFRARVNPAGMTRPARDPDEAAFLRERNAAGPFVEVDDPGWCRWRYGDYAR
jgi:hypothetical protein